MVMKVVVNDVGSFMLLFALRHLRFLEKPASKVSNYKFSWNPCNSFSLSQSKGKCSNVAVSIFYCLFLENIHTSPLELFCLLFICMPPSLRKFQLN